MVEQDNSEAIWPNCYEIGEVMSQDKPVAISVKGVEKIYKLYDRSSDRVREALGFTKKPKHKKHYALNGIDMDIYQGECVGIIGTNGSGKSTILKIITGVLSPSEGQVLVNGRISALLELGAGFNMEYNGIENIYLNGMMIGFSEKEIDEKLQDILDFADIGEYVYQPVKTYSSGMFVRLAFAVAINIEPEILIVDEALSVGDVFFQAKCYHKFEEFKEMGKTIVFVSHDLSSISKYCDRVVLLNKGVKLGEGSPKEMIDTYKRVLVGQYEIPDDTEHTNLLHDEELREKAAGSLQKKRKRGEDCGAGDQSRTVGVRFREGENYGVRSDRPERGEDYGGDQRAGIYDPHESGICAGLSGTDFCVYDKKYQRDGDYRYEYHGGKSFSGSSEGRGDKGDYVYPAYELTRGRVSAVSGGDRL